MAIIKYTPVYKPQVKNAIVAVNLWGKNLEK